MSEMLEGVFTALVTPFANEGIDWDALEKLIESQIENGIHGLVPCGTTGESATLSFREFEEVVGFVVEATRGRVPVLAGTGSYSTAEAVSRTQTARRVGADAALVVTPYYNRPTPRGLEEHYRRVAEVGLPVVLYHIPSRTGTTLTPATYARLASIPHVVATKEASGDLSLIDEILAQGSLRVFSGDDALTFPLLCLGASGVISVAANVAPRALTDLYDDVIEGNLVGARDRHRRLLPLFKALFLETNPGPVKAALSLRSECPETLRPPLAAVSSETREAIAAALDAVSALLAN